MHATTANVAEKAGFIEDPAGPTEHSHLAFCVPHLHSYAKRVSWSGTVDVLKTKLPWHE